MLVIETYSVGAPLLSGSSASTLRHYTSYSGHTSACQVIIAATCMSNWRRASGVTHAGGGGGSGCVLRSNPIGVDFCGLWAGGSLWGNDHRVN